MKFKIRHKLFLVLLAANTLLAVVIVGSVGWNFSRSFQAYLQHSTSQRLEPMRRGLAREYLVHDRDWRWLTHNHRAWRELLQLYLEDNQPALPAPRRAQDGRGLPPPQLPYFAAGMLLRDAQGQMIIGPPSVDLGNVQWLPVVAEGLTIGELGLTRQLQLGREIDQLFAARLLKQSAWIAAGVLLLSACLALPFARRLVQPVDQLQAAMQQLASGAINDVEPLTVNGHDELARLADDFNLLTQTLQHNLRARQQWVADISHELRTPVAVLRGELEALKDGVRQLSQEAVDSLHAEIMRLTRLIEDLHELSLSDMGALNYRREVLSLSELLDELFDNSTAELADRELTLELQVPEENYTLFADGDRLLQVLRNLLTNTLRYTAQGGRLRVTAQVADDDSNTVLLCWEDSAPGVADADIEHLFDRLYRGDGARDRVSGGSGLGLAICRAIVEAHRGTITAAHSALGGLAVSIRLPLYQS